MKTYFIPFLCLAVLIGCTERPHPKYNVASAKTKSEIPKKVQSSDTSKSNAPDSTDESGPTFDEVKAELLSRYDKVEHIDTTIMVDGDSLHIHEKYYCLKDNAVLVPKKYLWGGDTTRDFVTHSWVTHITIIKNKDTIINKIFKKSDFNPVVNPEERKYAIIFDAGFEGYQKKNSSIMFGYSITIPLTDVGVPAYIAINKNGKYKMLDEYTKLDEK
jgi:hypothetical protein